MTALLQRALDKYFKLPENQQEKLAVYLKDHEGEILDFITRETGTIGHPKKLDPKDDPWANPDIPIEAVDTGISDLAMNHDHYAWGTPKKYHND